jgi:alpha-tubulin suppressor-like RCC1 family protein
VRALLVSALVAGVLASARADAADGPTGTAVGWGSAANGRLGNGATTGSTTAPTVAGPLTGLAGRQVVAVAAGSRHSLAVTSDGRIWGWGDDGAGQVDGVANLLGSTVATPRDVTPADAPVGTSFVTVAAGGAFSLALTSAGTVWSWGDGSLGQTGRPGGAARPAPIAGLTNVQAIAAGRNHGLALTDDGRVYAWGSNVQGQLGTAYRPALQPMEVPGLPSGASAIAAGDLHSLAVVGGRVYGWGDNSAGQLADAPTLGFRSPVPVLAFAGSATPIVEGSYRSVAAGASHSLALRDDGAVVAFGSNATSQLGTAATTAGPVVVAGLAPAAAVTAGGGTSAARLVDGSLSTWGANASGQLGRGSVGGSSPTPAPASAQRVVTADLGDAHALVAEAPSATISPASLAFPVTSPGQTAGAKTLVVRNTSPRAPLFVTGTTIDETAFALGATACTTAPVQPGATCTITVTFTPSAERDFTGSAEVLSNAFDGVLRAVFTGTGALPHGQVSVVADRTVAPATPASVPASRLALQPRSQVAVAGGAADLGSLGIIGGADLGSLGIIGGGVNLGSLGLIGPVDLGSLGLIGPVDLGSLGIIGGANLGSLGLIPLAEAGLHQVKLSDIPLAGGWAEIKRGTPYELLPDQSVTLGQLLEVNPEPARLTQLTIADLVQAATTHESALTAVPLLALFTGRTPVSAMALPQGDPGWCARVEAQGFSGCGASVSRGAPAATGPVASLLELALAGFDIRLGLGAAGPAPIGALRVGAIGLAADAPVLAVHPSQIANLSAIDLGSLKATAAVADCTRVACGTAVLADAAAAGALRPEATIAALRGAPDFDAMKLGELAFGLLPLTTQPTEQIPLDRMGLLGTGDSRVRYTLTYAPSGGAGLVRPATSLRLPPGFTVVSDSTTVAIGGAPCGTCAVDPTSLGDVLGGATFTWSSAQDVPPGASLVLSFDARPGLALGRATIPEAAVTDTASGTRFTIPGPAAPVQVVDPGATATAPDSAAALGTDTLGLTWIPDPGARRVYRVDLLPAARAPGTLLTAALNHLPGVDLDLRVLVPTGQEAYEPPLRPTGPSLGIPTLGEVKGGLADASVRLDPEAERTVGTPLCATLAAGQPCTPLVAVGVGNQRGAAPEAVQWTHPGGVGPVFLEVTGYEGASSASPAALQMAAISPPMITGPPRAFPNGWTRTTAAPPTFAAGTTVVAITAWDRMTGLYGPSATTAATSEVRAMLQAAGGVELQVDRLATVTTAMQAADAAPTDPAKTNAVVRAIATELDRAVPGGIAALQQVMIVGGDDLIPSARLLDPEIDGNERKLVNELGAFVSTGSPTYAAAALGRMLSDTPYGAPTARPLTGRHLYVPSAGVSRLGERPDEILAAARSARLSSFTLGSAKALVTGYDFLADGADRQASSLAGRSQVDRLITPPGAAWTREDLASRFSNPTGPDAFSLSGHADSSRLLPPGASSASGFFSTQDILAAQDLSGNLVLSVGCHSGQLIADGALRNAADPLGLDFAQAVARKGGTFVGQTGYAFGATASVAYSEDLLARYVALLGSLSAAPAAARAINEYLAEQPYLDPYDEKVVQELAVHGVGLNAWANRTPLPGTPTALATAADAATGLQTASFDLAPTYTETTTPEGSVFQPPAITTVGGRTLKGGTTAAVARPVQPKLTADVTAAGGLLAKGVVIDGLEEDLRRGWDPALTRPVIDASANEAEPTFGDVLFPATIADVHRVGTRDSLAVVPARYRSTGFAGRKLVGDERLYRRVKLRVLYSADPDTSTATVVGTSAAILNGQLSAVVRAVPAAGQTIAGGSLAVRDTTGVWRVAPMTTTSSLGTGVLAGVVPVSGTQAEWFADVISSNGTVTHVASKGDNFVATVPPAPPTTGLRGTIVGMLAPAGGWYASASVRVEGADGIQVALDDQALHPYTAPVAVTTDGLHVVRYTGTDPSTGLAVSGSLVVPVDHTAPAIQVQSPTPSQDIVLRSTLVARYSCSDATSGLSSCTGSTADGAALPTSTVGRKTLVVRAVDAAGNVAVPAERTYDVVYDFQGWKPGVSTFPAVNRVNAGSTVPIRWQLLDATGAQITSTTSITSATLYTVSCPSNAGSESTSPTGSGTGITYDSGNHWFQDNRKFDKALKGTYQLYVLVLDDGTLHLALFKVV